MATEHKSRAEGVRRVLLTSSLVLAPALIAVGSVMTWNIDWDDRAATLATAVEQPVFWQTHQLISLFGFMLLVPAAIAAAQLVRRRKPGLALASVILVGAGAMMIFGAIVSETLWAAAQGVEPAALVEFDAQIQDLGAMAVFLPLLFAGLLGLLVLAVGLWRAKATALWVPILLAVSILVTFFVDQRVVNAVAEVGLLTAFVGIAWAYWSMHDQPTIVTIPEAVSASDAGEPRARHEGAGPQERIESGI